MRKFLFILLLALFCNGENKKDNVIGTIVYIKNNSEIIRNKNKVIPAVGEFIIENDEIKTCNDCQIDIANKNTYYRIKKNSDIKFHEKDNEINFYLSDGKVYIKSKNQLSFATPSIKASTSDKLSLIIEELKVKIILGNVKNKDTLKTISAGEALEWTGKKFQPTNISLLDKIEISSVVESEKSTDKIVKNFDDEMLKEKARIISENKKLPLYEIKNLFEYVNIMDINGKTVIGLILFTTPDKTTIQTKDGVISVENKDVKNIKISY